VGDKDWFDIAQEAGILGDADVEIVGEEAGRPVTVKIEKGEEAQPAPPDEVSDAWGNFLEANNI
jgi:hypothetical protein